MWTDEQAKEIHGIARSIKPDIKLHAINPGLQVQQGPDAIVDYSVRRCLRCWTAKSLEKEVVHISYCDVE